MMIRHLFFRIQYADIQKVCRCNAADALFLNIGIIPIR